jgi:hypothetical protein
MPPDEWFREFVTTCARTGFTDWENSALPTLINGEARTRRHTKRHAPAGPRSTVLWQLPTIMTFAGTYSK